MLRTIGRNALFFGALAVGATASGMTAHLLLSERGGLGPTMLGAVSVPSAIVAVVITLIVATGLAIAVGKTSNTAVGMFVLGGAIFGLSWRLGTLTDVVHAQRDGSLGTLGARLAIETVFWAALVLGTTLIVFRVAGPLRDVEPTEDGMCPHPLWSWAALKLLLAGVLMLPVVWFVAQSPTKGQALGAAFCGGMAVGLAGRLVSPHVQPIMLFAVPILFGGLGHLAAGFFGGGQTIIQLFVSGTLPPLSVPMPVDYAAGATMGVAVGLGWAKSFLHHEDTSPRVETSPAS